MDLTQEAVLALLVAEGGRLAKSDLVRRFRSAVDCDDPAQKERNRDLFKTYVNAVAVVKEIDGVRYVVLRKSYQALVEGADQTGTRGTRISGEQQRPPVHSEEADGAAGPESAGPGSAGPGSAGPESAGPGPAGSEPDPEGEGECGEDPAELLSPIELALRRSKFPSVRVKRALSFEPQTQTQSPGGTGTKPFALPLRVPPSPTTVEVHKLKGDQDESPGSPRPDFFRIKRRPPSLETGTPKTSEEPRETRAPSSVPLEQQEHEWLVRCAAGHWTQVLGLLLRDQQLADKRDFMSGFTALHWAAKWGNGEMLEKIMDLSREAGVEVDVNAKTHGGYTPLHIAAQHRQDYVMAMLVWELGAHTGVRDNDGKKAYHYLHPDSPKSVREMLGEPKAQENQDRARGGEKEDLDLFPDLTRGLQTISRLFQPHGASHKKKTKLRPGIYSLSEEPGEEREEGGVSRTRTLSDVFM